MYITYRNAARGSRATVICNVPKNVVQIGHVVPEMHGVTDKQTDRHAHHNTAPPKGEVNISSIIPAYSEQNFEIYA